MAATERLICASDDLVDGGLGVRFEVRREGRMGPAFAIRYRTTAHAFLNRCAHVSTEMDWQHGEFFDQSGLYLVCATHGARYAPDSGRCIDGRCNGKSLVSLKVQERDGQIYLIEDDDSVG
jgi:nitrite reductase/ring-hydroxylating ferredoxin subunit